MTENSNSTTAGRESRRHRVLLAVRALITAALVVAFGLHVSGMKIDQVGIMLLVLAMVPWLGLFLDAAELYSPPMR